MNMSRIHKEIDRRIIELQTKHLLRNPRSITSHADGTCDWNGQRLINFSGNDYLNLSHDVAKCESYRDVAARQVGATASALVSGRTEWHERLEGRLAEFEKTEAALLFPTGYAANVGLLTGLVQADDVVLCDRDNHASIIDACRQSDGDMLVFRRDRLEALHQTLTRRRNSYNNVFIVVDGVYSMDGTVPDLKTLADLAEEFEAALIVDEAHGTGVLGASGRGASELAGVEDRIFARVGTMSKAMGGLGGFVVSDRSTISLLRNTARTQFFSTALPPSICVAMLEALRIIEAEPARREYLQSLVQAAHQSCREANLQSVGDGPAAIIPIVIGNSADVQRISQQLQSDGFFVPAIRPPTVKSGTDRLRLSLSIQHTTEQIQLLCQRIQQLR